MRLKLIALATPALAGLLSLTGCGSKTSTTSSDLDEAPLTIEATLTSVSARDGGASADGGAVPADGGTAPAPTAKLVITARDGVTAVITDLWLYTLDSATPTPLDDFTSTAARKSPRLMLPAAIAGAPSGLSPADDGRMNGLMTNTTRGSLEQGAFVSSVNGTVTVTLPAVPTAPVLIVAGLEDQRYSGAAVVNPDGTAGTVPTGFGAPESHPRRSFKRDVAPILQNRCADCHNPSGIEDSNLYLVTGTRDDLVNDNFALKEQTEDCQTANPAGGSAFDACVQAINKAQYLVEPGAPAVSDLLQRARPDEDADSSALGLAWFGGGNPKSRYNATYGDRRMPSTTESPASTDWTNAPTDFDLSPGEYQIIWDWVAQGAVDN